MALKKRCPLVIGQKVACEGDKCKWFEGKKCTVPKELDEALQDAQKSIGDNV